MLSTDNDGHGQPPCDPDQQKSPQWHGFPYACSDLPTRDLAVGRNELSEDIGDEGVFFKG